MKFGKRYRQAALAAVTGIAAAVLLPAAASASVTFNLSTGNSDTWGTPGNTRTFTADDGETQVTVSAYTAVSNGQGGYNLLDSYLGSYVNGLGVTSSLTGVGNQSHTVDNQFGFDFLVFQFSKDVTVDLAKFNVFSVAGQGDSDATIGIGSTNGALDLTGWGDVTALFGDMQANLGGPADATRAINPDQQSGNLLFIRAGLFSEPNAVDNFKIASLTATPAVPEPATWAMMIGGMGLVGASMRRRASRVAFS